MNDETRPSPTEPIAPPDGAATDPFAADRNPAPASAWARAAAVPTAPAAQFSGRTPHKSNAVRAGVLVGTGLVVALGAAVAMGASPSAAPTSAGQAQTGAWAPGSAAPDANAAPGEGGKGFGHGDRGPGRGDGRGFGQISVIAISGSNLSLATADGWTRTIAVTSATTITKGGAAATLADIAVGDEIHFGQTRNADGTYTITAFEIVQPHVAGTVTAVGSDSITITLRDGTSQTIATTGSTTYRVERADGTRADVTLGSMIVASGEKAADGTFSASSVSVHLPHVMGTVSATTADTITITTGDGTTVTVHVGSGTTYRVAGVDPAKLSDIKAGMGIVVEGTKRSDGSIDAAEIGAGDLGGRGMGPGRGHDGPMGAEPEASTAPSPSAGTEG